MQSNHSQHVFNRPTILPTQIDLITPALVADADGEAHAAVRILVRGRGVNHLGAVNQHIAGFVIGDEPARIETLGELRQMPENTAESQPFATRCIGLLF